MQYDSDVQIALSEILQILSEVLGSFSYELPERFSGKSFCGKIPSGSMSSKTRVPELVMRRMEIVLNSL